MTDKPETVKSMIEELRHQGVEGNWVCIGQFGAVHGVRGDIRLNVFTADPQAVFAFAAVHKGPSGPLVKFHKIRAAGNAFIVRVDGVADREAAARLNNTKLFIPRDSLAGVDSEDEFYLADLIGLKAENTAGKAVGFVRAVENFGADDLLELVLDTPVKTIGRSAVIPFTKKLVPLVDIKAGRIVVALDDWVSLQSSEREESPTLQVETQAALQDKSGKKS